MLEPVVRQASQLSSGTIASLTGKRRYDDIDQLRVEFVEFCESVPQWCDTWQRAWALFVIDQARQGA